MTMNTIMNTATIMRTPTDTHNPAAVDEAAL
jgi:hypothetical protein